MTERVDTPVRAPAIHPVSTPDPPSSQRERRLEAVIAQYLQAVKAGRAPDRREFLERHWDLTDGLVSFFENEDRVNGLAGFPGARAAVDGRSPQLVRRADSAGERSAGLDFGEFEVLNEIASGGMGIVYKARHKRLKRIVALKTIRHHALGPSDHAIRRLRVEAEVVASLDHPNIVPIYDIGEHCGCPYLILKLIPGGDLERHVPRLANNPRAAARLMARVARTVHFAHMNGVMHRDLKPSNILLDLEGEPHVTDFGLARCIEIESGLTQAGHILGTPSYMAPEQVSGHRDEVTAAVDIYGLGAVLYKLLTGRPPFQAETLYEILRQVREREPTPLRAYNDRIDRDLEAICLKCLEKQPRQRYPSAEALSGDLERWAAGGTISARQLSRWERVGRWYHRNRTDISLSAAFVGLTVIFVLAAVATATVICNYHLAGETPRSVPRTSETRPATNAVTDLRGSLKLQRISDLPELVPLKLSLDFGPELEAEADSQQ
jgi:serine/threonine protein kinase